MERLAPAWILNAGLLSYKRLFSFSVKLIQPSWPPTTGPTRTCAKDVVLTPVMKITEAKKYRIDTIIIDIGNSLNFKFSYLNELPKKIDFNSISVPLGLFVG